MLDSEFVTRRIESLVAGEPKEFAWRVGISLSSAYNYLGGRTPTIGALVRIALVYGKTLDWFFREFQPAPQQAGIMAPCADEFIERRLQLVRRPRQTAIA